MIGSIVLAAGAGTRMGRQKMLLPFAGRTVVGHVVAQLQRAGVREVIVITGADADAVGEALAGNGAVVVKNPDYTRGMLTSLRAGLAAAPATWPAAIIALGDQPLITPRIVRAISDASVGAPDRIIVPTFDGRRGHPMALPRPFWEEALTRHDDVGLRGVLRENSECVVEVPIDSDDVLIDMDTPDDYTDALARIAERVASDDAPPK